MATAPDPTPQTLEVIVSIPYKRVDITIPHKNKNFSMDNIHAVIFKFLDIPT